MWPYGEVFEVAVVLDHLSTVEFLSVDLAAAWGIPINEINQRAIRQTISRELSDVAVKDHGWPQGHNFPTMREIFKNSEYVSAVLLALDRFTVGKASFGVLVGLPAKSAVFLYEVTSRAALDAIPIIADINASIYDEAPNYVSRDLYWWENGRFHVVGFEPAESGLGRLTFPAELRWLIDSMPQI